jgi:hypothetical protein
MVTRALGVLLCLGLSGCGAAPKRAEPKAAPAPPPKKADPRPAFLNQAQLKTGSDEAEAPVRGCYTLAYTGKDGGSGTLTVDFTVSPKGPVDHPQVNQFHASRKRR